jgi:hypothetical protein
MIQYLQVKPGRIFMVFAHEFSLWSCPEIKKSLTLNLSGLKRNAG